jgi:hypothetical protein
MYEEISDHLKSRGFVSRNSTKVVLPKTKSELARQINSLGQVEINVLEPIDKKNVGLVKSEIERFVGNGQKVVSVVFIKNK